MKSKYSIEEWHTIVEEYRKSHKVKDITRKYGVSKSTLYEWNVKLISKSRKSGKEYTNAEI